MNSEKQLQKTCISFLRSNQRILFLHSPNEITNLKQDNKSFAFRNFRYQQGVSKGVPDILIFNNNKYFHGLAIELKYKNNKPTEAQYLWLKDLEDQNWFGTWLNNFENFVFLVETYLNNPQLLMNQINSKQQFKK